MYNGGAFLKAIHEEVPQFIKKYSLDKNEIAKEVRKRFKAGDIEWFEQQADSIWGADSSQAKDYKKSLPRILSYAKKDSIAHKLIDTESMIKTLVGNTTDGILYVNKKKLREEYEDDVRNVACLSDIVNGATKGKISFGGSHPKSYWKERTRYGVEYGSAQEAFADIYECVMANPKGLEAIKTHLPKTFKVFEDMMEDLKKNGVEQ